VLVFWVGIVATFVARRARAWSALWITFGVLFVWLAAAPSSLNVQLTAVWYSDPFRLAYILAFLAIPIAAFTFAGLVETGLAVVRREPHPAATAAPSGSASPFALLPRLALPAAAVLGLALVVPAVVTSIQTIRTNYRDYSLVSADSRRAFAFLQAHVGRGEHVLNQRQDGSPWMYPLAGVAPLVALKTVDWDGPAWADRLYAADHADELATNSRVQAIFNDYDIHYVYVAPRIFDTDKRLLDGDDLAASGAFREVFRSGGVRVFEVSG
jgi:hypothetical protein